MSALRPVHDAAVRLRQAIVEIIAREQREWLHHGDPLPVAEIHTAIEALIEEEINARVQDAVYEIRPNDE
jgi:hypothetical protein